MFPIELNSLRVKTYKLFYKKRVRKNIPHSLLYLHILIYQLVLIILTQNTKRTQNDRQNQDDPNYSSGI